MTAEERSEPTPRSDAEHGPTTEAEPQFWIVVDNGKEEIEIWSSQEKAEESIDHSGGSRSGVFLYRVPASELARAFPNRPVAGGDCDAETRNKYIRKGWSPGTK